MIGDRNGYLNGVLRPWGASPRPSRPPAPTSDHGLAPAGHELDLDYRDGARCACGHEIDVSVAYWTGDTRAPDYVLVGAWTRHLSGAGILDLDESIDLRRALEDAERIARYGRPYHHERNRP